MREQCLDLALDEAVDPLDVVDPARLEAQQRERPVRRGLVLGKEVRIAGVDDAGHRELAGAHVIRMEPVRLPRVVGQHYVGARLADDAADRLDPASIGGQLAVDESEQHRCVARRGPRRPPAARRSRRDERGDVGVAVPRALGAVGADAHGDQRTGGGPLGERGAASELDVVGMGADGEHAFWCRKVDPNGHCAEASCSVRGERGEIAGQVDVERERRDRAATRTSRPIRSAASTWRAAESRAVGEFEVGRGRQRQHRGPVTRGDRAR